MKKIEEEEKGDLKVDSSVFFKNFSYPSFLIFSFSLSLVFVAACSWRISWLARELLLQQDALAANGSSIYAHGTTWNKKNKNKKEIQAHKCWGRIQRDRERLNGWEACMLCFGRTCTSLLVFDLRMSTVVLFFCPLFLDMHRRPCCGSCYSFFSCVIVLFSCQILFFLSSVIGFVKLCGSFSFFYPLLPSRSFACHGLCLLKLHVVVASIYLHVPFLHCRWLWWHGFYYVTIIFEFNKRHFTTFTCWIPLLPPSNRRLSNRLDRLYHRLTAGYP